MNTRVLYAEGHFDQDRNGSVFYVHVRVRKDIYNDKLIEACNLWTWEQIKGKGMLRFIQPRDGPDPGLKELDVIIRQGQEKQILPVLVNPAGTTLEQIRLNIMGLRSLKIRKGEWQIVAVTWPSQ